MTDLEKRLNEINEKYFLPLLTEDFWKENRDSEEYSLAQCFLTPYLAFFNEADQELMFQLFRTQIKYMNWVMNNIAEGDEEVHQAAMVKHIQYKKNIPGFLKIMRSFQFALPSGDIKKDIEFEKKTGLFTITKLTFEGERKGSKVVLEGTILETLSHFFNVLGSIKDEQQLKLLELLSPELYSSFFDIWFHYIGKKSLVKDRGNPRNKQQWKSFIKMTRAYQLHRFLTDSSIITGKDKITEKEKRFIGDFFLLLGICQDEDENAPDYLDTTHYNDVRNWIKRGTYLK